LIEQHPRLAGILRQRLIEPIVPVEIAARQLEMPSISAKPGANELN